jgi:hypothetical protein
MGKFDDLLKMKVFYQKNNDNKINVLKNIVYKKTDESDLLCDIYSSENPADGKLPVVILVHGEAPFHNLKDYGQYTSLGEILASKGLIAVTFNHRMLLDGCKISTVLNDISGLRDFLSEKSEEYHIDISRTAIWSFSAGMPSGMYNGIYYKPSEIKCLIGYYGFGDFKILKKFVQSQKPDSTNGEPVPEILFKNEAVCPLFIARAGLDNPAINQSLESFVIRALSRNIQVDFYNHTTGHHAFDVLDDNQRTNEILEKSFLFIDKYINL